MIDCIILQVREKKNTSRDIPFETYQDQIFFLQTVTLIDSTEYLQDGVEYKCGDPNDLVNTIPQNTEWYNIPK